MLWGVCGTTHCLEKMLSKPLRMRAKCLPQEGTHGQRNAEVAPSGQGESFLGHWQMPPPLTLQCLLGSQTLFQPASPVSMSIPSFWPLRVYLISPLNSHHWLWDPALFFPLWANLSVITGPDLALPHPLSHWWSSALATHVLLATHGHALARPLDMRWSIVDTY